MSESWSVEMFVYLVTALSALLLLPRSANWRLRLVIGTTGMQALAHAASELKKHNSFWQERLGNMTGIVELFGGALALTAIYLLKQENRERKSTDARLRLSEAVEPVPAAVQPAPGTPSRHQPMPGLTTETALEESAGSLLALGEAVGDRQNGSRAEKDLLAQGSETGPKQRKTRRFTVSILARIIRLDGPRQVFQGKLVDISQGGARISLSESLPTGALLRIEVLDQLYLGEVCSCEEWQGRYEAGIKFAHALDLPELSRILRGPGADLVAQENLQQLA